MTTKRKTIRLKMEVTLNLNQQIEIIYSLIVSKAIDLLRRGKSEEFRTYCLIDHTKNELNTHLRKEFLCYFWNITLLIDHRNGQYSIIIDLGKEGVEMFGNELTNSLLRVIESVIQEGRGFLEIEKSLKLNLMPLELTTYFYSLIAQGETNYVSITTIQAVSEIKPQNRCLDI